MVNEDCWAFVGSNSVRGARGITTIALSADETAAVVSEFDAYNVGAVTLSVDNTRLYAAHEAMTFRGAATGGCSTYRIDNQGALHPLGGVATAGQRPCRLIRDDAGNAVWTADFFGGTLSRLPISADGVLAPSDGIYRDPVPAGAPGMLHDVVPLSGGRRVGAMSVTSASFVVFDVATGHVVARHQFAEGSFARSVVASESGSGLYCMLQDPGEIHALVWDSDSDSLGYVGRASVLGDDFPGPWGTSALRLSPDGDWILAATRRTNTLSVLIVHGDGPPELTRIVPLEGATPRDFTFTPDGGNVIVAMQASDEVLILPWTGDTVYPRGTRLPVPSPASVAACVRSAS